MDKYGILSKAQPMAPPVHLERLKRLEEKFPHINPEPGEDLNIERNENRILKTLWDDTQRCPLIADIVFLTGVPERTIFKRARKLKWGAR